MPWGQIGAALIGGAFSAFGQASANKANKAAARNQMAFQERMSNSSYQRAMKDMRSAGLNPILAYKQGGAGTPGGATYQSGNVGSAAVQGAVAAQSSAKSISKTEAEIKAIEQGTKTSQTQDWLNNAQNSYYGSLTHKTEQETKIINQQIWSAKAAALQGQSDIEFNATPFGRMLRHIQRTSQALQGLTPAATAAGATALLMRNKNKGKKGKPTNKTTPGAKKNYPAGGNIYNDNN